MNDAAADATFDDARDSDVVAEERRPTRVDDVVNVEGLSHRFKRNVKLISPPAGARPQSSQMAVSLGSGDGRRTNAPVAVSSAPSIAPLDRRSRRAQDPTYLWAVNGVSLGLSSGGCFGLLGPNGAGKTSLLGVLTGELRPPTEGTAYVRKAGPRRAGTSTSTSYDIRSDLGLCGPDNKHVMYSVGTRNSYGSRVTC